MTPVNPGGQAPVDPEDEPDDDAEALAEEELDDAELPELEEELEEQGPDLLVPSSATIIVQRSCAGEPRSYSAHTRTIVCGRTKWVASLLSKKLVAVTTCRRGSPVG